MRRVILLVAVLSVFMHVGVAYASGPVGSVPPPQYPNWSCSGTCNSNNGVWSLTAGSSMITNLPSLYTNENVSVDVNSLVVPSNSCVGITVDTLYLCVSINNQYFWTFSNVSGSYHQIQIFCSNSCQGNYLLSVIPISAPSPTPTPNPSYTPTNTPVVPPTVTPPSIGQATHTPTVSPTPCVINAWGCDQPATATYVACETGVVVNYGLDPCGPTSTPTPGPTSTPDPGFTMVDCGVNIHFYDCNGGMQHSVTGPCSGFTYYMWTGCGYAISFLSAPCCGASTNDLGLGDGSNSSYMYQDVILPSGGDLCARYTFRSGSFVAIDMENITLSDWHAANIGGGTCEYGQPAGSEIRVQLRSTGAYFHLDSVTFSAVGPTATPFPTWTPTQTGTPGATWTPRPTFTRTPVASPTVTPIGFVAPTATILANIDTCLGTIQDCNLALTPIAGKIGGIPGLIATPMAPLNTSVFSPFQTIGITRGGCLSFGKLPVMIPHIQWLASPVPVGGGPTSTPNISGYVPISVTWTLPTVVGTPMRQGNFGPIDPMEFEPCNDPAVPTWAWDLSWNASTFFEWIGFFVWTIALIRRIFG